MTTRLRIPETDNFPPAFTRAPSRIESMDSDSRRSPDPAGRRGATHGDVYRPRDDAATDEAATAGEPTFPRPPHAFTDGAGRAVRVDVYDGGFDSLLAMYDAFEDADRAQGLPPRHEQGRRSWLASLLEAGIHLVARHGTSVVGHAALIPMEDDRHELIVFVASDYRFAGIGTELVETLLGYGRANGVRRVWLTVRRHNRVARRLYASVGFRSVETGRVCEMVRDL